MAAYQAGIPEGNAFLVKTPEIDAARNQMFAEQQQRRQFQQQEMLKLDPVVDREFNRIRSVDVPQFTDAYNQYKNIKKQQLFDPRAQRDPQLYQQLNQKANEALANTFAIADKSAQYNQMGKDLATTRRTHPDVYDEQFGDKYKTFMSTPYDQLEKTQYGDLSNPDNFRYQHTIDFNKIHAKALGKASNVYNQSQESPDKLTTTTSTYQYGANPKQYHDNFVAELAKLPNGEKEAASAMQHFTPEMIQEINKQYYSPDNQDKWLKTTGQPNPIPVEAQNPNSDADNYASVMSKLTWLNANTPAASHIQTTPNRGNIIAAHGQEQEKLQQLRFQQQKVMAGINNNYIEGREKMRQLAAGQSEEVKDGLAKGYFEDLYTNAQKPENLVSIPTESGQPLEGYEVAPLNDVKKELGSRADKYIISKDGKTMTGVFYKKDAQGKLTNVVDDTKTSPNIKDVDIDLKPVVRNFMGGKQKGLPKPEAPKIPVTAHQGAINELGK